MYQNIRTMLTALVILTLLAGQAQEAFAQKKTRKNKKGKETPEMLMMRALQAHVGILASDSLEGRRTGTPGEQKAVAYLQRQYEAMGIAPAGTNGYLQPFEVFEGMDFRSGSFLTVNGITLAAGTDFTPFPWSGQGAFTSEAAVALHEAGEAWWIDVDDIKEKHKDNPHMVMGTALKEAAAEAVGKGATAVLFYNGGLEAETRKYLPRDAEKPLSVPVYHVAKTAFARLGLTGQSETVLKGAVQLREVTRKGSNLAALIDNQATYTIIIGAHLDHLGYGEDENSRHSGEPAIHNGADDNASGTAAVLELARRLKNRKDLAFNYLLLHFSGEELGLFGSKYFTENPTIDLSKVSYMINLDMVGRLNDSTKALTIGGVGTSPAWGTLLQPSAQFTFKIDSSGTGPSDHTSFYRKNIPVLFFFTGLHTDYHKPSDDAEKLNYNGMVHIVRYIEDIIARSPVAEKPAFTKTREQSMGGRGFKVSIGIMPDYTFTGTGVKADGVVEGRPAQKAGLKANDIILQLGEHLITGVDTYMQALNRFEKGETTTVVVKRGSEVLQMPITF